MTTKKSPIFSCENCCYNTGNKKDYSKHLLTAKHIKKSQILQKSHHDNSSTYDKINKYSCECGKVYKYHSSLWTHKKQCKKSQDITNEIIPFDMVMEVIKQSKEVQNVLIEQNKELQNKLLKQNEEHNKQILELSKNQQSIVTTNNNTTNNNNQFNLNFFLNETCKDAMNIVDFVNSLKLTIHDFETTGRLGFVEGISRIFIKELRNMEIEKLPIHCTDFKRETLYIKDNDKWEKENDEKRRLKWAINKVAQLNLNQIQDWQLAYPESVVNNTAANEKFTELALVALGGRGEEQENKFRDKIIRNVLKEVVLDKK